MKADADYAVAIKMQTMQSRLRQMCKIEDRGTGVARADVQRTRTAPLTHAYNVCVCVCV
jgi:hypothetical protein